MPVEVSQTPWHYTTFWEAVDHWQTLIAGALALAAGILTVVVTRRVANRQIAAAREQADRMVEAAREHTSVTSEQTAMTVRLERRREASEARAFRAMLKAAMARVLDEAARARKTYPQLMTPQAVLEAMGAGLEAGSSPDALAARQCITKGAFAELRAASIRLGGPLIGEFLDLEREIDTFAMQWEDKIVTAGFLIRMGKHAGLDEQLAMIEAKATELRDKAASERRDRGPQPISA